MLFVAPLTLVVASANAQEVPEYEDKTALYQVTWNWQRHPGFRANYSGANSLTPGAQKMYTFSATAHLGFRPWEGGELYFNPEISQGMPFTDALVGLGGFTNGEITRAGGASPTLYRQRLFLRQTWNRGGAQEKLEPDFNQMAGTVERNRTVLTLGNFSTLDVFDDNSYAKDPRTQFMNWGNWTYSAFDYAADARGFGWGAALEWYQGDWVVRAARMSGPKEPNGLAVDLALGKHYGDQLEIERAYMLAGQPGKLRVLAWRNRAVLASYTDALTWLKANPGNYSDPRALIESRNGEKIKYGLGFNVEQALGRDLGLFVRAMKADGRTETHAFTEADASVSMGLQAKGASWGRPADVLGLALGQNYLSGERKAFLAAGGTSFFIGDGGLNYAPETIFEVYYNIRIQKGLWVSLDLQRIQNPAYNSDRGPLSVFAFRLHGQF